MKTILVNYEGVERTAEIGTYDECEAGDIVKCEVCDENGPYYEIEAEVVELF